MASPKLRPPRPEFSPLSIARMLWKHRALIAVNSVVIAGIICAVVYRLPSIYKAEAVILVDSQKIPEKFVASTVQVTLQDSLASISQQLLSATRLQQIIKKFDLYSEERKTASPEAVLERMRKDLSIALDKGWAGGRPGAFRISYEGRYPQVVAGVVNEISGLFIQENSRAREQRAAGTSLFLESQLEQAKKSLEEQEANLSQFKLRHSGELPQQEGMLLSTLGRLHSELQANEDAIGRAQQNKLILENTLRQAETSAAQLARSTRAAARPATVRRAGESRVERFSRKSDMLKAQLAEARVRYSDEHPDIKRLSAELQNALNEEQQQTVAAPVPSGEELEEPVIDETNATPEVIADLNREKERIASTRLQLELLNKDIRHRAAEQQTILKSIAEYQRRVEALPIREQAMASLTRDYETSAQNYSSLLSKKISAEMSSDMEQRQQSERFTLVEPARVPTTPVKPKRILFYGAAGVMGIGISLALALAIEVKKNCFLGEWELPPDVSVIGMISVIDTGRAKLQSGYKKIVPKDTNWVQS